MHIRASVASTAHKTVTLRKIILSNDDITEFETALFAVTCQTQISLGYFGPKIWWLYCGRLVPSRSTLWRAVSPLAVWDDKLTAHSQNEAAKVSIYDYLQIKLPCFYSFSFKLWWVRWRPVSINWVMKRNGHPREPVAQNYCFLLSGTTRLICQWLHSNIAAKSHSSDVFCIFTIKKQVFVTYLTNLRQIWPLSSNKQLSSASMRCRKVQTPQVNDLKTLKMCLLFSERKIF